MSSPRTMSQMGEKLYQRNYNDTETGPRLCFQPISNQRCDGIDLA